MRDEDGRLREWWVAREEEERWKVDGGQKVLELGAGMGYR